MRELLDILLDWSGLVPHFVVGEEVRLRVNVCVRRWRKAAGFGEDDYELIPAPRAAPVQVADEARMTHLSSATIAPAPAPATAPVVESSPLPTAPEP